MYYLHLLLLQLRRIAGKLGKFYTFITVLTLFCLLNFLFSFHIDHQTERIYIVHKVWSRNIYVGSYSRVEHSGKCNSIPSTAYAIMQRENICYYSTDEWTILFYLNDSSDNGINYHYYPMFTCTVPYKGCQRILRETVYYGVTYRKSNGEKKIYRCEVDESIWWKFKVRQYHIIEKGLCN